MTQKRLGRLLAFGGQRIGVLRRNGNDNLQGGSESCENNSRGDWNEASVAPNGRVLPFKEGHSAIQGRGRGLRGWYLRQVLL
jgi:hypothetical protein